MGQVDWKIWRPIIAKKVTLKELEEYYSLLDLELLHEAMDIEAEINELSYKQKGN